MSTEIQLLSERVTPRATFSYQLEQFGPFGPKTPIITKVLVDVTYYPATDDDPEEVIYLDFQAYGYPTSSKGKRDMRVSHETRVFWLTSEQEEMRSVLVSRSLKAFYESFPQYHSLPVCGMND